MALTAALALAAAGISQAVAQDTRVFTVGNYPVEATAKNAVAAKRNAIADGQTAALRSLLKRLVPVTLYSQLRRLKLPSAADMVTSVQVRSERNSQTLYEAELDFAFEPAAVQQLLRQSGVPFVEEQAPPTTVVLIYRPPEMVKGKVPRGFDKAAGQKTWRAVWTGLDLENALTPVKAKRLIAQVHPDTINMTLSRRGGGQRILAGEYGMSRVVLAVMQPDLATKRLNLEIAGEDAVGPIRLSRRFRFTPDELDFGLELAAVVTLGILEGRWKVLKTGGATYASAGNRPAPIVRPGERALAGPVRMIAQFDTMGRWQQMRRALESAPGVQRVDVNGLSTSEADISVAYSGTVQQFQDALSLRGLSVRPITGGFLLR